MNTNNQPHNLIACLKCDTLSELPDIKHGQSAICPCCGGTLFSRKKNPIERTMAVALAGLLLCYPALTLPIVGIRAVGIYNEASLIECIRVLINHDAYLVSFCVFMFTIAIPIVRLLSAFYLCLQLKYQRLSPALLVFFRSYHKLDTWVMVHVFFLGIIVSIYKLLTMATLTIGAGLFSILLLLLCSTLIANTLDHHYVWEKLEKDLVSTR